jgi:hypothetical protein
VAGRATGARGAVPRSRILLRERIEDDRLDLLGRVRSRVVVYPRVEVGSRLHVRWRAEHAPVFPGHFAWQRQAAMPAPGQSMVRLTHEPGLALRVHRAGLAGGELAADASGWRRHEYRVAGAGAAAEQEQRRAPPAGAAPALLALSTFASWAELARSQRELAPPMTVVMRDLGRDLADDAGSGRFVGRVLAHRGHWGTGRADVVSGADDPALVVKMSFELEPLADLSGPTLLRLPRGASASLLRRYTLPLDPEEQTCRGEVHTETIRLTLPPGRAVEGRLPQGVSFRRGALSCRSHYEASREDGRVLLAVVRELEVRCTAPRLGADGLAHREALRAVLRKDLWAQVTLR